MSEEITPMLRQYMEAKRQYPDAILFFRMGDFYEMFFEDACIASKALDITLTSRNKNSETSIPMAGVPHHSAENYISRLLSQGFKVAICEQVEDPKTAKGIVKREVVQVITPGVSIDLGLEAKSNNFLISISHHLKQWGIAYLDFSTGDLFLAESPSFDTILQECYKIDSKEIIIPESLEHDSTVISGIQNLNLIVNYLNTSFFDNKNTKEDLLEIFELKSLESFSCEHLVSAISAVGGILEYLRRARPSSSITISRLIPYYPQDYLILDEIAIRNLELMKTMNDGSKKGSLLNLLDETVTSMGARLLKRYLAYPLRDVIEIKKRQSIVSVFLSETELRDNIRSILKEISDLERLNTKIITQTANARDLLSLFKSVTLIPKLKEIIASSSARGVLNDFEKIDSCIEASTLLSKAITNDPPISIKEGGLIKQGYNSELDEIVNILTNAKGYLNKLEIEEKKRTGISSLKIRFNQIFGYYIEVTKANLDLVPSDYIRKQTLTSAERFITPELKEYESKILGAEERKVELEYQLFLEIRDALSVFYSRFKAVAVKLAELDVYISLGEVASLYSYTQPIVDNEDSIEILEGRHPVIEQMPSKERFVPNDIYVDNETASILILTGPNMAGKSTIMRQVALIALMAQIGSFVPAKYCKIGVLDRIFTRVGASDNLSRGQSTFMVEMTETARIMNFATSKSLVLLDEIGRGTSTFDGLSIAWAVAESLHDKNKSKVLFATHYHELIDLCLTKKKVKNYNVAVTEWGDKIIFLRKLTEGGASRSYGIQVARLAGLPISVIERSKEILYNLEQGEFNDLGEPKVAKKRTSPKHKAESGQLLLFGGTAFRISEKIKSIDINNMTPVEALKFLSELKSQVENE